MTIDDCRVQTFRAGGKGGQNQNKRDTGVRVIHDPSGAVGVSRSERGQLGNKRLAFSRMAQSERFQNWARLEAASVGDRINRRVDELMKLENLIIQYGGDSMRTA